MKRMCVFPIAALLVLSSSLVHASTKATAIEEQQTTSFLALHETFYEQQKQQQKQLSSSSSSSSSNSHSKGSRRRHLQGSSSAVAARKGPTGTPLPIPAPPPPPSCIDNGKVLSLTRKILLNYQGRPASVTDKDIETLERLLIRAYNEVGKGPAQLACFNSSKSAFYSLDKVMISRSQFVPYRQSVSGNLTQPFTIVASVQARCKACQASTFELLTEDVVVAAATPGRKRRKRRELRTTKKQQEHRHSQRQEPSLSSSSSSSTSSSQDGSRRSLATSGSTASAANKAPLLPTCLCRAPSKKAFLQAANLILAAASSRYRPSLTTPITLLAIQDLVQVPCPSPVPTTIEVYVVLNFGDTSDTNITTVLNATAQSQLLARYITQYYNNANALQTTAPNVCDSTFLSLTGSAEAVLAPPIRSSNTNGRVRHRQLPTTVSLSKSLTTIYKIVGSCRGCPSQPPLYNDAVKKTRRGRQLERRHHFHQEYSRFQRQQKEGMDEDEEDDYDDDDEDDEEDQDIASFTDQVMSTMTTGDNNNNNNVGGGEEEARYEIDPQHRQLPELDGLCYCPVRTNEHRPPSGAEYLDILNTQLDILSTSKYLSVVGEAQTTVQVKQVNCSTNMHSFDTFVTFDIVLERRPNNITDESNDESSLLTIDQIVLLEQAFRTTYNFLAQQFYCDPFFRSIDDVQFVSVAEEYDDNNTTTTSLSNNNHTDDDTQLVVVFHVTGTCRGCPSGNTTLFDKSDSRRSRSRRSRQLAESALDQVANMASSGTLLDLQQPRALQQQSSNGGETICFCPISVIGDRAQTLNEFLGSFNSTIIANTATGKNLSVSNGKELSGPPAFNIIKT